VDQRLTKKLKPATRKNQIRGSHGRRWIDGVSRKSERERSLPLWIDGGSVVLHWRKWGNRASRGKERGVLTFENCREEEREQRKWCRALDVQRREIFKSRETPKKVKKKKSYVKKGFTSKP
jgi:hypothetical protein